MMNNESLQSLIEALCEEYSPETAQKLIACGHAAVPRLVETLWRADVDPYGHDTFAEILVHILLATRCPKTMDILVSLLEHDNADVRRRTVKGMGESGDRRAVHILRIALYDRNDLVQRAAAQALVTLQYGRESVRALCAALHDTEPRVRYFAIRQLEEMRAAHGLIEATYAEDPVVRQIAVWSLGRLRQPQAVPALIDALVDADLEVRGGAVWSLGNLGDPRAIAALLPLRNDREPIIAKLADDALHKLGFAPVG